MILALDIETTGLHNYEHEIRSWSLYDGEAFIHVATSDDVSPTEALEMLESEVSALPAGTVIATWNGKEFDMPFLHRRFGENGIESTLWLAPMGGMGKYGKPVYNVMWANCEHFDVSDAYEEFAKVRHVRWGLKEVAKAVLGADPVKVDARGENIEVMDNEALLEYNDSDSRLTYDLALEVLADE